jgi:hypothetical protein
VSHPVRLAAAVASVAALASSAAADATSSARTSSSPPSSSLTFTTASQVSPFSSHATSHAPSNVHDAGAVGGTVPLHGKRSNGYLVVGLHAGDEQSFSFDDEVGRWGYHLEGGRRLGTSPVVLRGQLAFGTHGPFTNDTYVQGRAGIETRHCEDSGVICGSVGVDLGYTRDVQRPFFYDEHTYYEDVEHRVGVVPRVSTDLGGPVRLRLGIEYPISRRVDSSGTTGGLVFSVGTGYAF